MTVKEYRNRLMDAFHNADCDELIAVVVRPEESEFKHLEWLLKNHYHNQKQQPCEDYVSRADALKALDCDIKHFEFKKGVSKYMDDIVKLLDIIYVTQSNTIKALPPVTPKQEPCEDCISRRATVERLCKVADFMNEKRSGSGSPYIMAALFIQDNKDEFPSVTPKEKTGHWEYVQYDGNPNIGNLHCSECDRIAGLEYKYCPNCGARMVSE